MISVMNFKQREFNKLDLCFMKLYELFIGTSNAIAWIL
jgi:hypothetical protein